MSKEFEKDFEISMLFHAKDIIKSPSLAGIFQKDPSTGEYKNDEVNIAFKAYCMAMGNRLDVVERCNPNRHISVGMKNQFHGAKWSTVEELFATVLHICNNTPVG